MAVLPETELMKIEVRSETDRAGHYVIGPLAPGYGVTIGNSLRRVLLSSLEGSAISAVRIEGVTHEFATLPGMIEDVVAFILNLKTLRVKLLSDEPATIRLIAKGRGEVRASQFAANPDVEIVDPEHYLATLDKAGKLELEAVVERGRGYVPTEQKQDQNRPLGTISIDSIFTPVKKVHYDVEHTRVGGITNFDNLILEVATDGTVHPRDALRQAAQILVEHLGIVTALSDVPTGKKGGKKRAAKVSQEAETFEAQAPGVVSSEVLASDIGDETPVSEKSAKKVTKKPDAKKSSSVKISAKSKN